MSAIIKVEGLGKQYKLGEIGTGTLSHDLNRWISKIRGREDGNAKIHKAKGHDGSEDYVWALKDISFSVGRGDVLGVIGQNGAGKSTLLKILSKVTRQTTGRIKLGGKIASLLEVGTGFHGELTGRENIYLNGAILGMTKAEITKKFDEIVDFSGVEKYIDTPVKRYSSGMYMRLAFAVAAHLDPDILIVDEVLAVGDAEFQRKCIGKMKDVSNQQGRTILFVSHNLSQIQALCNKGILLDKGRLQYEGDINQVITRYVQKGETGRDIDLSRYVRGGHTIQGFRFLSLTIVEPADNIYEGDVLKVKLVFETTAQFSESHIGIILSNAHEPLIECRSTATYQNKVFDSLGMNEAVAEIPLNLMAGNYTISIGARSISGLLEYIPSITNVEVLPNPHVEIEEWKKPSAGVLITDSKWQFSF